MDLLASIYRYLRRKCTVYTSLAIGHPPACRSSHHSHNGEEPEDRLSALPDDILLNILERLCLRSAVGTSILSRRWRRLPLLLSRLVIDIDEFRRFSGGAPVPVSVQDLMARYAEATERLLAPTSERAVKLLRLAFLLCDDPSYLRSIGQAVAMAVGDTEPELVDLSLWTVMRGSSCTEEHSELYGQRFRSFLDACPSAFRCLTSLTLRNLELAESDVQNIVRTCARLRDLCLRRCGQLAPLRTGQDLDFVFKIDAPSSRLVTLSMFECVVARVEITCAPRLARLSFDSCWFLDCSPPLWFGHAPQLRHLCFASALMCHQKPFALSACLSNVTSLSVVDLDFMDEMVWIRPEDPRLLAPKFRNLKELRLQGIFPGCDLKWTLLYVAAAPSLNSFYVKISRHICERNSIDGIAEKTNVLQEAQYFKHCNLNVLEIEGFQAEERLISFIRLVVERAINLRRIRLRGKEECKYCDHVRGQTATPVRSAWDEGIKNLVKEQIAHGLPSLSIELSME